MEPIITTIVGALVAGATAAAGKVATQAITDTYEGLKRIIGEKYSSATDAVKAIEAEPDSDLERAVLAKRLDRAGAANDAQLKATAQSLLDAVEELKGIGAAAPLFDFDRLHAARNVELSDIEALGTVFRARDASIGGDFKASGIRQKASIGEKRKN